jgi:hypothetical protein
MTKLIKSWYKRIIAVLEEGARNIPKGVKNNYGR